MALRFTLRQLEYFVAVGEEGSIVAASRRVNVSSPSISAAITQLEDEFGLRLFVRKHAHGLTLTPAGRAFLQQARRTLREAQQMHRLADQLSGNVQGALKLGCLLNFAQIIVPGLRRSFVERYDQVQLAQVELDQLAIFEQLREARIDLALTYDLDIPSDITFLPLVELPPYVMLSADHPLAAGESLRLSQLQPHPLVLLDLPHSSDYFLSLFERGKLRPAIAERTKDMAVLRSLVANNFGYSFVNIRPLNDRAPDGKPLRFLPLSDAARPMHLGLALVDQDASGLTVQAFVEHCRASIPAMPLFRT